MKQSLFFLAIIPPPKVAEQITQFKTYAAHHFDSSHALKSPPHITLLPPFRFNNIQLETLKRLLPDWLRATNRFNIELKNFAAFAPRVIYVDVIKNPVLVKLQQHLKSSFENSFGFHPDRHAGYHPHMTVAFKDLSRKMYDQAWDYFSSLEYEDEFEVVGITILKHLNDKWTVMEDIRMR